MLVELISQLPEQTQTPSNVTQPAATHVNPEARPLTALQTTTRSPAAATLSVPLSPDLGSTAGSEPLPLTSGALQAGDQAMHVRLALQGRREVDAFAQPD